MEKVKFCCSVLPAKEATPLSRPCFDWGEHTNKFIDIDMAEYVEGVMEQE